MFIIARGGWMKNPNIRLKLQNGKEKPPGGAEKFSLRGGIATEAVSSTKARFLTTLWFGMTI